MARPKGELAAAVREALNDTTRATPAAQLAILYATRIDASDHMPLVLAKALRTIRGACLASADAYAALDALDKVDAALSAVSVAGELGPKLLATLDALLLTPKAQAGADRPDPTGKPAEPTNPLQQLRDELQERRDRRPG